MIRQRLYALPLLGLMCLGLSPRSVHAETIVSNLGATPADTSPVSITTDTFWAQQFTSGGGGPVLTQIVASLGNYDPGFDGNGDPGDFTVLATLVAASSASTPPDGGTLVTTLTFDPSSLSSSGFGNVAFTPVSAVSLDPSLFYWFVLTGTSTNASGGSLDWQFAADTTSTGTGALTGSGRFDTSDGTWTIDPPYVPPAFMIEVNAVPEPSSLLLAATGLSGVGGLALRHRRRAA